MHIEGGIELLLTTDHSVYSPGHESYAHAGHWRSGELLDVLIYGEDGDGYVIIASKGGLPNHPIWYLNLEANPECELMVGPKAVPARARVAEGEERARLWKKMAAIYPPYDEYQERAAERTIPLVVLDPAS